MLYIMLLLLLLCVCLLLPTFTRELDGNMLCVFVYKEPSVQQDHKMNNILKGIPLKGSVCSSGVVC